MIARLSVRQPVMVNILTLLTLVGGVMAYRSITMESFPLIQTDVVSVVTVYPSASPSEVEKLVTIPIEEKLADLDIIEETKSISIEGRSAITLKLRSDVEDLTKAVLDIQNRVNQARLPEGVQDDPIVAEMSREWSIMRLAVSGGADYMIRKRAAEDLRDQLQDIEGVSSVELAGLRDREFWVEIDPVKLEHYNLGLDEVVQAIRDKHVNLPGGAAKESSEEVILRTVAELGSPSDIAEIVLSGADGRRVRLSDVAKIRDTFEEPRTIGRTGGERAINLTVSKQRDGNTIKTVDRIFAFLETHRAGLPESLKVTVTQDGSERIRTRISVMLNNGLMGLLLVLVLLWAFLDLRIAIMAALGIIVSFMATIVFMKWGGTSLNMVSCFGLIIVLGMLVDDTIVVCENIYRYMQRGMAPVAAAVRGANEVFWPVVAAVSTSIAAFMPLLMMYGMMGKFLRWIPIVVTLALLASLVEAFFVLPSHMADFARVTAHRPERAWFKRLRSFYTYLLCRALRWRYVVAIGVPVITALLSFGGVKLLGFELFPRTTLSRFSLKLKAPVGTDLEQTEQIAKQLEAVVLALPKEEVESVQTTIGQAGQRESREAGTHVASVSVNLTDADDREREGNAIIASVRRQLGTVKGADSIEFGRSWHGPSQGKAVEVRVRGERIDTLLEIAGRIEAFMLKVPGIKDVNDDVDAGKAEARIGVDEAVAKSRGLDARRVARSVQIAFGGLVAAKIQTGREEVDVRVRLDEAFRRDSDNVRELKFKARDGQLVPFSAVASLERGTGFSRVNRFEGKRVVTISADVDKTVISSVDANALVRKEFEALAGEYPGYQLVFGGQEEERVKSLKSLALAMGVALVLIYCILGCLFSSFLQPLVVMSVIPLGFLGVSYGLFVHGQPIGLMAIIGTIALSGVVVNDSLVFIEFINRLRTNGVGIVTATVIAGRQRLRPIILTTLTTMLGLAPMMLEIGGGSSFLTPMAIAIVWGIAFATLLTLIVIPCFYMILNDVRKLLRLGTGVHELEPVASPQEVVL